MPHGHSGVYEKFIRKLLISPSLNLGSGDFMVGDFNIDIEKKVRPDIIFNLERFPYPLRRGVFRSVILHHSLEHVEDPGRVLMECKSLLKVGGKIIIVVPSPENKNYRMHGHKNFFTKHLLSSTVKMHFKKVNVFGYRGDSKEINPVFCRVIGMFSPNQYVCTGVTE
jgi:SAM-dependent methyltransferase